MAKILIVDDRPINREYLVTVLSYFGHTMTEAADGLEALRLAQKDRPDLVITDILMPTMDGEEFVKRLRADPVLAQVPIIFYTATYMAVEAEAMGKSCGAFAVLIKPAEPELVANTVQAALGLPVPVSVPAVSDELVRHQVPEVVEELPHDVTGLEASSYRLAALLEAGRGLASERDPDRLLETFCRAARSILVAKYAAVGIVEEGGSELRYFFSAGANAGNSADASVLPLWAGSLGKMLAGHRSVRLRGVDAEQAGFSALPGSGGPGRGVASFLGVPVFSPERTYGWLALTNKVGGKEFSEEDERAGAALAAQVAVAYENAQRYLEIQLHTASLEEEMRERKRVEAELEQNRNEQLRLKDEFLSHVSHELRSPLAAVHQFTTILLDGLAGELKPEQRQYLEIVLRNCRQLKAMIDDLLVVTRAEVGKVVVRLQCANVADVIRETAEALRAKVSEKHIELSAELAVGLPQVWVDPARTRQVLVNLIENAAKFTPERGSVQVGARIFGEDPNFALVSVTDTGNRIKPENRKAIFERLFQESSGDESRKGLGLGLYIARDLVARQGGRIWVESKVGKGSTFFFTVPVFSLARLLGPFLTPQSLDKGCLSVITVSCSSGPENVATPAEQQALSIAREVVERSIRPESDLVLPGLCPAESERHLYVLARADAAGVQGLANRIRGQLRASRDLLEIGLAEPQVSFTTLPLVALSPDTPWDVRLDDLASRIEKRIGALDQR